MKLGDLIADLEHANEILGSEVQVFLRINGSLTDRADRARVNIEINTAQGVGSSSSKRAVVIRND